MTHSIRTTMRPDLVVEVDDQELLDLTRMGVVLPEPPQEEVTQDGEEEPEAERVEEAESAEV